MIRSYRTRQQAKDLHNFQKPDTQEHFKALNEDNFEILTMSPVEQLRHYKEQLLDQEQESAFNDFYGPNPKKISNEYDLGTW